MRRIDLYRAGGCWVARAYGEEAAELLDLFDTDTLPTPWMDSAPTDTVLAALQTLNPDTVFTIC